MPQNVIANCFSLLFLDFHWASMACHCLDGFSIQNPSKDLHIHWRYFKICAQSCERMLKTHNLNQNENLLHATIQKSWLYIAVHWFVLILLDFRWLFIAFPWFSLLFLDLLWLAIPTPWKNFQTHCTSFSVCANSCKMITKCITFCKLDVAYTMHAKIFWFHVDFHWPSLIFIDWSTLFHWPYRTFNELQYHNNPKTSTLLDNQSTS